MSFLTRFYRFSVDKIASVATSLLPSNNREAEEKIDKTTHNSSNHPKNPTIPAKEMLNGEGEEKLNNNDVTQTNAGDNKDKNMVENSNNCPLDAKGEEVGPQISGDLANNNLSPPLSKIYLTTECKEETKTLIKMGNTSGKQDLMNFTSPLLPGPAGENTEASASSLDQSSPAGVDAILENPEKFTQAAGDDEWMNGLEFALNKLNLNKDASFYSASGDSPKKADSTFFDTSSINNKTVLLDKSSSPTPTPEIEFPNFDPIASPASNANNATFNVTPEKESQSNSPADPENKMMSSSNKKRKSHQKTTPSSDVTMTSFSANLSRAQGIADALNSAGLLEEGAAAADSATAYKNGNSVKESIDDKKCKVAQQQQHNTSVIRATGIIVERLENEFSLLDDNITSLAADEDARSKALTVTSGFYEADTLDRTCSASTPVDSGSLADYEAYEDDDADDDDLWQSDQRRLAAETSKASTDSFLTAVSGTSLNAIGTDQASDTLLPLTRDHERFLSSSSAKSSYSMDDVMSGGQAEEAQIAVAFAQHLSTGSNSSSVSRNKTFTRKHHQTRNSMEKSYGAEDLNANTLSALSNESDDLQETPKIKLTPATPSKMAASSVLNDSQNRNTTTDEESTPRAPAQTFRMPKNQSPSEISTNRATAIVAPVVNNSSERLMMSSSDDFVVQPTSDFFGDPSSLDYLEKMQGSSSSESSLYRQSLYTKFDPLMASTGSSSNMKQITQTIDPTSVVTSKQSTPQKQHSADHNGTMDEELLIRVDKTPVSAPKSQEQAAVKIKTPSSASTSTNNDSASSNVGKVGQQSPQCPQTVLLKKKTPKTNIVDDAQIEEALKASSPSPRRQSLLNDLSASAFPFECDYSQLLNESDTANTVDPNIQRIKMQCQAYVVSKEKEWIGKFKEERERADRIASASAKELKDLRHANKEYEKTIEELCHQTDALRTEKLRFSDYDQIVKERDQALEDLQTVDNALAELHRRYESLRSNMDESKKNEEKWREKIATLEHEMKNTEEMFYTLKQHAEEQLEIANAEILKLRQAKETDTLALKAQNKRLELQNASLDKSLEQKLREIKELSAICDELIQKVDNKNSRTNRI